MPLPVLPHHRRAHFTQNRTRARAHEPAKFSFFSIPHYGMSALITENAASRIQASRVVHDGAEGAAIRPSCWQVALSTLAPGCRYCWPASIASWLPPSARSTLQIEGHAQPLTVGNPDVMGDPSASCWGCCGKL